ncbi:MAG: pPIWI-associating nuclease domain-containing protein [Casimicrobiaceae bacterium]
MATPLANFIGEVDRARRALNGVTGKQLHSQRHRDALRAIVEKYFENVRPGLSGLLADSARLQSCDETMQTLIALCHRHGSTAQYKRLLGEIKEALIAIDALVLSANADSTEAPAGDAIDRRIIETLRGLVPSAALSYQQALLDLAASERLSWRGPATDLRECLRETLDHLAPDAEVMEMPGFRQEPDTPGPTMKQKVRFVLKNRGTSKAAAAPAEAATEAVEAALGTFVRSVYTRSSVSTHTPTDRGEVVRVADLVRVVLCEMLEIRGAR